MKMVLVFEFKDLKDHMRNAGVEVSFADAHKQRTGEGYVLYLVGNLASGEETKLFYVLNVKQEFKIYFMYSLSNLKIM